MRSKSSSHVTKTYHRTLSKLILQGYLITCGDAFLPHTTSNYPKSIAKSNLADRSSYPLPYRCYSLLFSSTKSRNNNPGTNHSPRNDDDDSDHVRNDGDEIPTMDWLTNSLANQNDDISPPDTSLEELSQYYMEEHSSDKDDLGDVPIPTTGVSVADEMEATQKEKFTTEFKPIKQGIDKNARVAQIITKSTFGSLSFEPIRYLVGLPPSDTLSSTAFLMIDIPPYTEELANTIRSYMGSNGRLAAILVTHKEGIHYDEAPSVYTMRRADLQRWSEAFPNVEFVAYRLDIPRDCRESITQVLDGYGPFALEVKETATSTSEEGTTDTMINATFVETGRPLTYERWDHDVTQDIMTRGKSPPDDVEDFVEVDEYSPAAIRSREEGKDVLAVYTPGNTFGSVSYVFPNIGLCCSGLTIPVEDNRAEENPGMSSTGPLLDCRGYITTSKAGITRQMESARMLINEYHDRFRVVLPSRGDPLWVEGKAKQRRKALLDVVDDFDRIGQIYEQLGITSFDDVE